MSAEMREDHTLRVIVSNVPQEDASRIARALVHERLAACVNMLPGLQSVYIWEGEVVEEQETCLLIKTTQDIHLASIARLIELHPYSTPEVLVCTPQAVHALYADWATQVTSPSLPIKSP
jgi:periplasmic divalent cation tolerance protein